MILKPTNGLLQSQQSNGNLWSMYTLSLLIRKENGQQKMNDDHLPTWNNIYIWEKLTINQESTLWVLIIIVNTLLAFYNYYLLKKCFCHVGFLSDLAELSMASWSKKAVVRVFHYKCVINHQLEMVEIFQISDLKFIDHT